MPAMPQEDVAIARYFADLHIPLGLLQDARVGD
jgi:hypothetical protein